jgi:hypothetical protein
MYGRSISKRMPHPAIPAGMNSTKCLLLLPESAGSAGAIVSTDGGCIAI